MSNNSLRVRPYSRTRGLSCDHESPNYSDAFDCIPQIHSGTQQNLIETHVDVKTTDNYMSNNSLRVRHDRRTRRLSRDHESPKYAITSECILQIHSATQQTLIEAHVDVKTTDNYMSSRPSLRLMWMSRQLTIT